jgi:hypothetical protein
MINFDSPNRESCTVREVRTNTPLQALSLMNETIYVEAARKMAERLMKHGGDRIGYAYRLVLAREPSPGEARVVSRVYEALLQRYRADPQGAADFLSHGDSPRDPSLDPVELAAWAGAASLVLNLDEALTKQ